MGTTLTGTTPQDTYDSLIKVTDNGPLTGSLKKLTDGLGNDSSLSLSTTAASFSGSLTISGDTVGSKFYTAGSVVPTAAVSVFLNANYGGPAFNNSSFVTGNGATGVMIGGDTASYTYGWIQGVQTDNGTAKNLSLQPIGGNVGIGTSTPSSPLTVYKATSPDVDIQNSSALHRITGDSGSLLIRADYGNTAANTHIQFSLDGTEVSRFTPNGLTFNGDTAAANALDDYEEGTWTIGVSFGGASVGVTTSINGGTYTKVGRQVSVNGFITLTSKGSSTGVAAITGLPFTLPSNLANISATALWFNNITFANQFQGYCDQGGTKIDLYETTEAGGVTALTDADFANNSQIMLSATYFV